MSVKWPIGSVGPYEFFETTIAGDQDRTPYYGFKIDGTETPELYLDLDHAIASAIAERHTGRRGAGGSGVGTAADWFMTMVKHWDCGEDAS